FQNQDQWAVDVLEQSVKAGGSVSPLLLGKCYWRLSRFTDARRQYELALKEKDVPEFYVNLCLNSIRQAEQDASAPPTLTVAPPTPVFTPLAREQNMDGFGEQRLGTAGPDGSQIAKVVYSRDGRHVATVCAGTKFTINLDGQT